MKVLVVDDEEAIRELLQAVLSNEGYQVICAAGGLEALELAPRERPDLALVDVMMPGMDGRQLVARLRELPEMAGRPMVMMSAVIRFVADQPGVVAFLAKPFDLDQLLATLEQHAR